MMKPNCTVAISDIQRKKNGNIETTLEQSAEKSTEGERVDKQRLVKEEPLWTGEQKNLQRTGGLDVVMGAGLTLVLLNPDIPYLCKQWRSRSVGQLIGSALFAIKNMNLYQQSRSSNPIG